MREGRKPKDRGGRSWRAIAAEAWGTDILRERSYLWLVASRLFILAGVGVIYNLNVLYMERSLGLDDQAKTLWGTIASARDRGVDPGGGDPGRRGWRTGSDARP